MKAQKEKIIHAGSVSISTEYFGISTNPTILLIAGATVSMLYWDADFCHQLADEGFFVIRYDNRDVGRSTYYSPGSVPYDILDMANDAINILDAYKIKKATIMGISLGGLIAQIIAIKEPNRVHALILMSTGIWGTPDSDIPQMDTKVISFQAEAANVNWEDEKEVVDYLLQSAHLMAGHKPVDYLREERRIKEEFRRAGSYRSMFNHALLTGGETFYNRLHEITTPTLIIHGTADKIWHFNHTKKLLSEIRNSQILTLKGTGHELNHNDWAIITTTIKRFLK